MQRRVEVRHHAVLRVGLDERVDEGRLLVRLGHSDELGDFGAGLLQTRPLHRALAYVHLVLDTRGLRKHAAGRLERGHQVHEVMARLVLEDVGRIGNFRRGLLRALVHEAVAVNASDASHEVERIADDIGKVVERNALLETLRRVHVFAAVRALPVVGEHGDVAIRGFLVVAVETLHGVHAAHPDRLRRKHETGAELADRHVHDLLDSLGLRNHAGPRKLTFLVEIPFSVTGEDRNTGQARIAAVDCLVVHERVHMAIAVVLHDVVGHDRNEVAHAGNDVRLAFGRNELGAVVELDPPASAIVDEAALDLVLARHVGRVRVEHHALEVGDCVEGREVALVRAEGEHAEAEGNLVLQRLFDLVAARLDEPVEDCVVLARAGIEAERIGRILVYDGVRRVGDHVEREPGGLRAESLLRTVVPHRGPAEELAVGLHALVDTAVLLPRALVEVAELVNDSLSVERDLRCFKFYDIRFVHY